jgi:NAD(P)H-flavin reductase
MWLALEATDEFPAAFEPGHVLGLGLKGSDNNLMRHAYTVSRGKPAARQFEHLYRIVSGGHLSPRLARLAADDEIFFHGPFHTPIQQEIQADAERIVLISTGAGIGPLFGYAEKALSDGETRPLTLYAGFRQESHTCLAEELNGLTRAHPNFAWHFTLTRPQPGWRGLRGRVTESVSEHIDRGQLLKTHFHLVGNGEMVQLVRSALLRAGVSPGRVSIETYFNHYVNPPKDEVEQLAVRFTIDSQPVDQSTGDVL